MNLTGEQQDVFDRYVQGKNIFITGPGGTGKSALIKMIKKHGEERGKEVQVCALTGCAAVLLECKAKTIHSWSGIGLANGPIDAIVRNAMKKIFVKKSWQAISVLVIDEVSMMSKKLFEALDRIAKIARRSVLPMGGIQLILSGDFYQLPPVGNADEPETSQFCFESDLWFQTIKSDDNIELTQIFRQTDKVYQSALNQIREGYLKKSLHTILMQHVDRPMPTNTEIRPTKLYPTRYKVEQINSTEMQKLKADVVEYEIKHQIDPVLKAQGHHKQHTPEQIAAELTYLERSIPCDTVVKIKQGAQVMCIVNIQLENGDMICNGSRGIVSGFDASTNFPIVQFMSGYRMTMNPHCWPSEKIIGVSVSQVPIILAWALTIHKAQGVTLDMAQVDAGSSIFECGQTYVALSRVKSLDGLYLTSFDVNRIKVNSKVRDFYKTLKERKTNASIESSQEAPIAPIASADEVRPQKISNYFAFVKRNDPNVRQITVRPA